MLRCAGKCGDKYHQFSQLQTKKLLKKLNTPTNNVPIRKLEFNQANTIRDENSLPRDRFFLMYSTFSDVLQNLLRR